TYASIEQGRRRPSVESAMRIASILGFDWTLFFE
ncbi:XRE family transcriptional regulator, partial [Enterococcus faecalis]|nr:XRE family transcriptional regulator [Enterococcus faecalis]